MRIDEARCMGCGQCMDVCRLGAIDVEPTKGYSTCFIDQDICINCGECKDICPGGAIEESDE